MRLRSSALTESGLLSARDTEAVETPARAATARMPCFDGLADSVSVTVHSVQICNVTFANHEVDLTLLSRSNV